MAADFDPKRLEKAWARYRAKATEAHTPFTTYLNDDFCTSVPIQKFLLAFCVCLKGAPAEPFN